MAIRCASGALVLLLALLATCDDQPLDDKPDDTEHEESVAYRARSLSNHEHLTAGYNNAHPRQPLNPDAETHADKHRDALSPSRTPSSPLPPPNPLSSLLEQWRRKTHGHSEDGMKGWEDAVGPGVAQDSSRVGRSERIDCENALRGEEAKCWASALHVLQQYSEGQQHIAVVLQSPGVCTMDQASVLAASQVCPNS